MKKTANSKETVKDNIPLTVRNMARSNLIVVQDPQPSTSYARDSAPIRQPNTYPKVLNLGRGRGKGKFPLGNWTSVVKGCGQGLINENDQS